MCRGNGRRAGRARNPADLSSRVKRESRKIFGRGLGSHQNFLISQVRRRGPLGNKGQLEVIDDPVHHRKVHNKGYDPHRPAAAGLLRFIMHHLTYLFTEESPLILVNLFK